MQPATSRSRLLAKRTRHLQLLTDTATPEPSPTAEAAAPVPKRVPATMDRALYSCSCGYAFQADVSTSVSCPHCGAGQPW